MNLETKFIIFNMKQTKDLNISIKNIKKNKEIPEAPYLKIKIHNI